MQKKLKDFRKKEKNVQEKSWCQQMSFESQTRADRFFKVAFGRSVRFRNGFGISVFSVFDGEFEGRSPSSFAGGGLEEGGSLPPAKQGV